jgi:hypothetical protein
MKKTIFGLTALVLLFTVSCKKTSSPTTVSNNTWTFKGISYTPTSVFQNANGAGPGVIEVDDTTIAFGPSLYIYFASRPALPTTGGTYKVVSANYDQINFSSTSAKEIGIISYVGSNAYYSTGGNGSNQTATVTVSSTGKVTVSGSGIELVYLNGNTPTSDSSALSISVTQQ